MRGGKKMVRAEQQTPPTRPRSRPKEGMERAQKAERMASTAGPFRSSDWATPLTLHISRSRVVNAARPTTGKVKRRFSTSRTFTVVAAGDAASSVTTTEETPAPKPRAPMMPKIEEMVKVPRKAVATEPTKDPRSFSRMEDSISGRVKWMKKRYATLPKMEKAAAGCAQAIPAGKAARGEVAAAPMRCRATNATKAIPE